MPDRRPSDPDTPDLPVEPHRPVLDLSLTQLVGGSLAAATGAALASRLGVAGTILGAACVSLISAIAGAAYTQSIRTTRARVRVRTVAERRPTTGAPDRPAPPPVRRRLRLQSVLAGAAAVFVIAFASITGYELFTGRPISGGAGGTTLNEVTGTGQAAGTSREDGEPAGDDPTSAVPTSDVPASQTTPTSPTTSGSPTGSDAPPSGSTSAPPSATDPASTTPPSSTGSPPSASPPPAPPPT